MPEDSKSTDAPAGDATSTDDKKKPEVVASRVNEKGEPIMAVKIYAPFKNYYDKDANSISAENDTGRFDILPRHKNFITLLSPCEIVVRRSGEDDFKIKITRAIMHVKADKVTVFLDV